MRLVLGSVAGVLSLALVACDLGGGGSSNPNPTPTPTPTSTATPSPTPTPTTIAYTTSETALQYTTEGGVQRVANAQSVAPAIGQVFTFEPAQNGYIYTLLNGTVNPSASEAAIFTAASGKTCDVTPLCFGNGFVFQQVQAGAGNYYLSRLLAGAGNPVLVLSVTSFGLFEEALVDAPGGRQLFDLRPFAYGVASASSLGSPATPVTSRTFARGLRPTNRAVAGATSSGTAVQ